MIVKKNRPCIVKNISLVTLYRDFENYRNFLQNLFCLHIELFINFQPPVAKKPWSGTLDVSQPGPICVQGSNPVRGSEDCLYLKVYTTKVFIIKLSLKITLALR